MPHLNRVEQIGRLTRDVEFRTAASTGTGRASRPAGGRNPILTFAQ